MYARRQVMALPSKILTSKRICCRTIAECGEPIYDEELKECPKCGCDEIIRLGRITGYLSTTIEHFNAGKKQEFEHRVDHIGQSIFNSCD